jgi:hypothetical protein
MPDVSTERKSASHSRKAWLMAAIAVSVVGGVSVAAFAGWWLIRVSGDCGVVRFYEQAFAVILVGAWLVGTATGVGLTVRGFIRKSRSLVPGVAIAVLVNVGLVLVCAKAVHDVREADFSLKSTERLMQFLREDNPDNRTLAAYELGERRAVVAVPTLCAILEDGGQDINLRLNAAGALGKIAAPPPPSEAVVDQAVASLVKALGDKERFVPQTAAEALGRIGDLRAVEPLAEMLCDGAKEYETRVAAAKALKDIGGEKASEALGRARTTCKDEELVKVISKLLDNMKMR